MSGIEAVRKIVETEAQARKIVEEVTQKAQKIVSNAYEEADKIKADARTNADRERNEILSHAESQAETEGTKSDIEAEQVIREYQRLAEERKNVAIQKALELIING